MTTDSWSVTTPQAIEIDAAVTRLRAIIVAGRISVVAHEHPTTRIEVSSIVGRELRVRLTPTGELTLDYPFMTWDNPIEKMRSYVGRESVEIAIAVPREAAVSLTTVSANILAAQVAGTVGITTVSGQVTLDQVVGDINVKTVSGGVLAREIAGGLVVNGVSGEFTISGELDDVKVNTVSGAVLLDLTSPDASVKVDAVSANVTVRRPLGYPLALDVTGLSGSVVVDATRYRLAAGRVQVGEMGRDDGLRLRIKTMSGNLTVLGGEGPAPAPAAGAASATPGEGGAQGATS